MERERIKKNNECEVRLTCYFCNTILFPENQFVTNKCPKCQKFLPKCSICFFPIKISENDSIPFSYIKNNNNKDNFKNKNCEFIFCSKCKHGGHINHYLEWFDEFNVCPFSECNCLCMKE